MRKLLFVLVIILLLIFSVNLIYQGCTIGDFEILGIKQIIEKNDTIDQKNAELSILVSTSYPGRVRTLQSASEILDQTKQEYENQAILLADNKYYGQSETYEIEFLWTKIGNYAKDNNVEIKMDVTNSTTSGLYDLNFTVNGRYSDVTDFIYAIENDSKLGFKIEDFNMVSGADVVTREYIDENGITQQITTSGVQGTFACKEIRIDIKQIDGGTTNTVQVTEDTTETDSTDENAENNQTTTEETADTNETTDSDVVNEIQQ